MKLKFIHLFNGCVLFVISVYNQIDGIEAPRLLLLQMRRIKWFDRIERNETNEYGKRILAFEFWKTKTLSAYG